MPSTFHVTTQLDRPAPGRLGVAVHAAVYALIADVRPSLAAGLHGAQVNPLSVGLTRRAGFGGVLGHDGRTLQFRVACADDALLPALREILSPGQIPTADHDELRGRVVGADERHTPYDLLGDIPLDCRLSFPAPTLLKSGDVFVDRPSSALLLHAAVRRWQAFAPESVPEDAWSWVHEHVASSEEDIRSVLVSAPKQPRRRQAAFTGSLCLSFRPSPEGRWLARAAQLLTFTGAGVKTMYGLGEVVTGPV
ncbi:CRISPR system precrRNA processing endoribonuclease RAMP protein Cas6 [Deinococcus marmoris]|uniref:CRISPR system precrRNA processing endoribonuclease RAMP protein Cas6 n=1 Tax=Deinococcus marmoris TaxID=249408 RepID=UPI000496963D|nr:CRISPR system precrRNA processing endoribonuclease RAMP protein Cas6 [Deinococcus marmoris]